MTQDITCETCLSRPAKMIVLRRRFDDEHRTFVCSECAAERSKAVVNGCINIDRFVSGMERKAESTEFSAYSCRLCGTTIADIVADGKPGCCVCYSRFSGEVELAVDKVQGCTRHIGKSPVR
jgi:protein-arginine kinase activator protein McsA